MKKLITFAFAAVSLTLGAQTLTEGTNYLISNFVDTGDYIIDNGEALAQGNPNQVSAMWQFIPSGNEDCYYIQNAFTGNYMQSSTEKDIPVKTGNTRVEYKVLKDNSGGETNGFWGLASTDQPNTSFTSDATIGLNDNNVDYNGFVCGYPAKQGVNKRSYWKITAAETGVTSKYHGSEAAVGKFYLYNPKADKWLQPNMVNMDEWTTLGKLGDVGMEIELKKPSDYDFEGYQIYVDFTNNGELNGSDEDRFYFDQGDRDLCDWLFVEAGNPGVEKGYTIMIRSREGSNGNRSRIQVDTYIGSNNGVLTDDYEYEGEIWQLVSREERLRVMQQEVANGPVDCSWLIPWFDRGRNDHRADLWNTTENNHNGGGVALDGKRGYPVQEYWHMVTMKQHITLEGLPEGTYSFSVQSYYRKDIESEDFFNEWKNGTLEIPAKYFANAVSAPVKCIFDDAKTTQGGGFERFIGPLGLWVPDAMDQAGHAMYDGNYINNYLEVPVTDGNLTIGVEKNDASWHDWFVVKRFYLRYDSKQAGAEDLTGLQSELADLISKAKELYQTESLAAAIAGAEDALENATTSTALLAAIETLQTVYNKVNGAMGDINNYLATKPLAVADGADINEAEAQFADDDFGRALRTLRYARRLAASPTHNDVFEGNAPASGKFYIYNVGRKLFLEGGSDWGAHAALGFIGTEVELQAEGEGYVIDTGLNNGGTSQYLNNRGYMDTPNRDVFIFKPVEGKQNVYNIVQKSDNSRIVAWNPYGSVDAGNSNELNVSTENLTSETGITLDDEIAQWKLVKLQDRIDLLDNADKDTPIDCSFLLENPGFNQRASIGGWEMDGFSVWDRGGNHNDFICESWTKPEGSYVQHTVEGLPKGKYEVSLQGFYRNSTTHKDQTYNEFNGEKGKGVANVDPVDNAFFYVNELDPVALPYILDEAGNAPGEGANAVSEDGSKSYNIPDDGNQAAVFFRTGLYKVTPIVVVLSDDDAPLTLGVKKVAQGELGDWVVTDNYRLTYYGNVDVDGIGNVVEEETEGDGRIFNLQGIEVKNSSVPGVYIQNGKKFIVR